MKQDEVNNIDLETLAGSFGVSPNLINHGTADLIAKTDLRFRPVVGVELENLILEVLHRIEADSQVVGAPERKERWQNGWSENLHELYSSGDENSSLVPKFIRPGAPIRWMQRYVRTEDPLFELNYVKILRSWFANQFFSEFENIYEFGCGTGFNLLEISKIFPQKKFFGSDFVEASVEIVRTLASKHKPIKAGQVFDMLRPDPSYEILANSAVFTFGAIEQLAGDIDPIFEFFLKSKGELFLHIEPEADFYDQKNLFDHLAYKFQTKRGYSRGLSRKLRELESAGRLQIIDSRRLFFGSLFMEGYNLFVWKPRRSA